MAIQPGRSARSGFLALAAGLMVAACAAPQASSQLSPSAPVTPAPSGIPVGVSPSPTSAVVASEPASPSASLDPLDAVRQPMSALEATRLVARVTVAGNPDWQVTGYGAVWVATGGGSSVDRLDPATDTDIASVPIDAPCLGMAAGFGSVWVPDCSVGTLDRIDPVSNRVIARITVPFNLNGEGQIAIGAGAVWVPDLSGRVSEINPGTNKVSATFALDPGLVALTFGFGSIWGTNTGASTLVRMAPNGKVLATISVVSQPRFLTADPSGIWVLGQGDGSVSRIDPATNKVSSTIVLEVPGTGGCIAAGGGSVWVTMPGTPVSQIDTATNRVVGQFQGDGGDCIGYGFGSVWLSNNGLGDVWRIKP
jgi:virginiamycin B lyase